MTKRFSSTDLKGRLGFHEYQIVADLPCPFCTKEEVWLEMIVEHLERSSTSRSQRYYCGACQTYFERSPAGENTIYEVSDAFRTDFAKTPPFEAGDRPTRVHTHL
ncbi:hypothetical protein ACXR0O_05890 [Verrucomicrobiota bacterium sgz303538]